MSSAVHALVTNAIFNVKTRCKEEFRQSILSQIPGELIELFSRSTIENICIDFENNTLRLPRNSDTFIPKFINSNHPIQSLDLIIGGSHITRFPLDFCNKLCKFNSSEYIYKLPWELLKLPPLYLIAMQYHDVIFKLNANENCIAKLYGCNTYLENDERRNMASSQHSLLFKQFQSQEIELNNGNNTIQLNFTGIIKGIFLDNIDITQINNLSIVLNGHNRLVYDNAMLNLFTEKISNDCYYLSLDNEPFNNSRFNCALNLDRIDTTNIIINTNQTQNIVLYAININILRIMMGMAGLAFMGTSINIVPSEQITGIETNIYRLSLPPEQTIEKILEGDNTCPISHNTIRLEDKYMICTTCNKNFSYEQIQIWLAIKLDCPLCRAEWDNNNIYINPGNSV